VKGETKGESTCPQWGVTDGKTAHKGDLVKKQGKQGKKKEGDLTRKKGIVDPKPRETNQPSPQRSKSVNECERRSRKGKTGKELQGTKMKMQEKQARKP